MPQIDAIDSTWIPARPAEVALEVADPGNWARWWPGLRLDVDEDRGEKGVRWLVPAGSAGPAARLTGSAEVWLQPMFEGVVAHFFLRLDPVPGTRLGRRRSAQLERFYRERTKRAFWSLADRADPDRLRRAARPTPPVPPPLPKQAEEPRQPIDSAHRRAVPPLAPRAGTTKPGSL